MASIGFDIFWRDHGAARGSRDLGNDFNRTAQRSEKMKDAVKVAALAAGVAIVAFGKKSIEVASSVNESTSKIQTLFGASSKSVLDFGETTATSLGISKRATLEAAGVFGNLFVALKIPQAEAAKMSTKLITLAADLASFNDASPADALEAIRSGLVGETEPLRKFGVNMNDATLRAQALKLGLISNIKEAMTPAVKAQAAYGLIMVQTGKAQGDFAKTSGSLANQQRLVAAQFEDLQGKLGQKLLPVVVKLMDGMLGLLNIIAENQRVITPLAVGFVILAASIWGVNKAALGATRSMAAWNVIMSVVGIRNASGAVTMLRLQKAMVLTAGSAAVVGTAFAAVWADEKLRQWRMADTTVKALADGMARLRGDGALSGAEIELFQNKMQIFGNKVDTSKEALERFGWQAHDALDQGWGARIARMDDLGQGQKDFAERTAKLDQAFADLVKGGKIDEAQRQFNLYATAAEKAGLPVASLRRMFPQFTALLDESKNKTTGLALATEGLTGAIGASAIVGATLVTSTAAQTRSLRANSDEIIRNKEMLLKHANATLVARGSENGFEAAIDDATKALKDNGRTLDKHTEKGRANRAAIDQVASSTLQWRQDAASAGKSQKVQNEITEQGRRALERLAGPRGFGMSKKAAHAYATEILAIPKRVSSTIQLKLVNGIPKTLYGVRVGGGPGSTRGGVTVGMATGGAVFGGNGGIDDIPAMLTRDEHVWTKREVRAAGGHDAVKAMRRGVLGLAEGGPVFADRLAAGEAQIAGGTSGRLAKRLLAIAQAAMQYNPTLSGALNFARAQTGKPYIWGGVGPRGYDCSGFMSALLNVVQGVNPYHRRFATGSFPTAGFIPGPGSFMIGSRRGNPGHMAGTINGVNVESSGGVGAHTGRSARGARDPMFSGLYHLKGYAGGGRVEGDAPFDMLNPAGRRYLGDDLRKALLFDGGGIVPTGHAGINRSGRPERMLSPRQTRSFDRLVQVLDRRPAGAGEAGLTIQILATGSDIALENKIVDVVRNARAHGRLK